MPPRLCALAAVASLLLVGCEVGSTPDAVADPAAPTGGTVDVKPTGPAPVPTPTPTATTSTPTPSPSEIPLPQRDQDELLLAFAGDANAFSHAGKSTTEGLGEAGRLLRAADWSMVNLETALADSRDGLTKQPKLYTFLTGRAFPEMLQREGIDLVSLANNHAMDFGVEGMRRTLAIRQESTLPMIGVGTTTKDAFAPWEGTVRGRPVVALVGNDILESNMDWRPREGRPGVAMVKTEEDFRTLVEQVAAQRARQPEAVVVVFMHWGVDYQVCTTRRQESMARELADAGASIVVGTHAHRVQRAETIGNTLVAYGLGNFNFHSDRTATRETGVLTVHVPRTGAPTAEWAPGRIVEGRPELLTGSQAQAARERWSMLQGGC